MLNNAPISAHLPAVNLSRAKQFYGEVLGLKAIEMPMPGIALFKAGDGTRLMIYEREATKADHTVAGFEVENIEEEMEELKKKGVVFEEYDFPDLKTVNGIATVGEEKSSWFKDTEGNILCLHQSVAMADVIHF